MRSQARGFASPVMVGRVAGGQGQFLRLMVLALDRLPYAMIYSRSATARTARSAPLPPDAAGALIGWLPGPEREYQAVVHGRHHRVPGRKLRVRKCPRSRRWRTAMDWPGHDRSNRFVFPVFCS
jgi:hypothetical protein